jgi:hypothetical protein
MYTYPKKFVPYLDELYDTVYELAKLELLEASRCRFACDKGILLYE